MPSIEGKYCKHSTVKKKLRKLTKNMWVSSTRKYSGFADDKLYLPTLNEVHTILGLLRLKPGKIVNESFDCDDYSFALKGLVSLHARDYFDNLQHSCCIGIVWGDFMHNHSQHACNWVLDNEYNLHWIEPQEGEIKYFNYCKGGIRIMLA